MMMVKARRQWAYVSMRQLRVPHSQVSTRAGINITAHLFIHCIRMNENSASGDYFGSGHLNTPSLLFDTYLSFTVCFCMYVCALICGLVNVGVSGGKSV